jgi:predicted AAA+ superfamily ATPase
VGSTVSYANLARDLERDPNTIKRWLRLLEDLYLIFRVTPYHKNITRSLLKEPKFYFYDHAYIDTSEGAHLENIVASALLKELHFLEDTQGVTGTLHFVRTKDGKEVDFLMCIDQKPTYMIEVKSADDTPVTGFHYFSQFLPGIRKIQLVKNLAREKTYPDGVEIRGLIPWLANLPDLCLKEASD